MDAFCNKININPAICVQGSKLAYENAKRLLNCSKLLGEQGYFGPATSLAILGAEEAIKSLDLLFLKPIVEGKESFSPYFWSHKKKHASIESCQGIMVGLETISEVLDDLKDKIKNDATYDLSQLSSELSSFIKKKFLEEKDHIDSKIQNGSKWWKQANRKKNEGLYVDFENGKWKDPVEITSEEFENSFDYTSSLLKHLESYQSLPSEFYTKILPNAKDKMKESK